MISNANRASIVTEHALRQHRKHLHTEPLNPEPDQLNPGPILAPVVPEPVHREDMLLDLPRADPRKIHDHVVSAVEFQRERSVSRDLGQAILLVHAVDHGFGRFVEERNQECDQPRLQVRTEFGPRTCLDGSETRIPSGYTKGRPLRMAAFSRSIASSGNDLEHPHPSQSPRLAPPRDPTSPKLRRHLVPISPKTLGRL